MNHNLDPNHPDFDLEEWAEAQWVNWPDIETDLTFRFNWKTYQFEDCIAYFGYWKFGIDIRLDPIKIKHYPVELLISLEPDKKEL